MDPHCKSFQPFFFNGNRSIFLALASVVNIWLPSSFYCVYPCCYYKTVVGGDFFFPPFFLKFRSLFYFSFFLSILNVLELTYNKLLITSPLIPFVMFTGDSPRWPCKV